MLITDVGFRNLNTVYKLIVDGGCGSNVPWL